MEKKKKILLSLFIAALIALCIVIENCVLLDREPIVTFILNVFVQLFLVIVGGAILTGAYWGMKTCIKFVDKNAIETRLRLSCMHFSQWLRKRNAEQVFPCLQNFLYRILKENEAILKIPVGKDTLCLSPQGAKITERNGCVFYIFQLLVPLEFEGEEKTLRELVQSYIMAELQNYGIEGLKSTFFNSKETVWSVYLDRLRIENDIHMITFELLYVCSGESLQFLKRAIQRDRNEAQGEPEVYDDELN